MRKSQKAKSGAANERSKSTKTTKSEKKKKEEAQDANASKEQPPLKDQKSTISKKSRKSVAAKSTVNADGEAQGQVQNEEAVPDFNVTADNNPNQQRDQDDIDEQMEQVLNEVEQQPDVSNPEEANFDQEVARDEADEEQVLEDVTCKDQQEEQEGQGAREAQNEELIDLENNIMNQYDERQLTNSANES